MADPLWRKGKQDAYRAPLWAKHSKTDVDDDADVNDAKGSVKGWHRADCQWCKFEWIHAGKPTPPGRDADAGVYEGPQHKETLYCVTCGIHLCSASCWMKYHCGEGTAV